MRFVDVWASRRLLGIAYLITHDGVSRIGDSHALSSIKPVSCLVIPAVGLTRQPYTIYTSGTDRVFYGLIYVFSCCVDFHRQWVQCRFVFPSACRYLARHYTSLVAYAGTPSDSNFRSRCLVARLPQSTYICHLEVYLSAQLPRPPSTVVSLYIMYAKFCCYPRLKSSPAD